LAAYNPAMKPLVCAAVLVMLALVAEGAAAQAGLPAVRSTPGPGGSQTYSLSLQALIFLTALTFLPAALLMMTSFTRIIIVLSLLRQALGTVQTPPNQVLVGLSLFLTFFVMAPVFDRVYTEAYKPLSEERIKFEQAVERAAVPLKGFMLRQTRESDLALFVKLSASPQPQSPEDIGMKVLVPAFVISELKTAFQIGFVVFLPFLIIDLVVSSVLMSMGMMMLSPVIISLPFKLMLFVMVDGWNLLVGSLVRSFGV
jgi:flagellar biosynthetic protein FliP